MKRWPALSKGQLGWTGGTALLGWHSVHELETQMTIDAIRTVPARVAVPRGFGRTDDQINSPDAAHDLEISHTGIRNRARLHARRA